MVGVSASVNLPLHHKVHRFSSGTSSPGWSRKKGRKTVVVWWLYAQDVISDPVVQVNILIFHYHITFQGLKSDQDVRASIVSCKKVLTQRRHITITH